MMMSALKLVGVIGTGCILVAATYAQNPETTQEKSNPQPTVQSQVDVTQIKTEIDSLVKTGKDDIHVNNPRGATAAFNGIEKAAAGLSTTTTKTPLLVRGGAMTFRYDGDAWLKDGNDPCIPVDTSGNNLKVKIFSNADPDQPAVEFKDILGAGWRLDLHGRDDGFEQSETEGLTLKATTTCGGNQKGIVLIKLDGSTCSQVNKDSLKDQDETSSQRYQRFPLVASGSCTEKCDDEDACEHLGYVDVVLSAQQATPKKQDCLNGECLVKIIQP